MSVLVEALSLVVARKVLDVSYPGGTDAFLKWMSEPHVPCRCCCADENLVSASFFGAEDATEVGDDLLLLGFVAEDNGRFYELAFIDQAEGPTLPCDWLEWTKHAEGYSSCWLAGTEPGEFHAPDAWTPEQSRRLSHHDIRNEPGRCLKLAEEPDGHEIWLDFETGNIAPGNPCRPDIAATDESPISNGSPSPRTETVRSDVQTIGASESTLLSRVRSMLDTSGHKYTVLGPDALSAIFSNLRGIYTVYFTANDASDFVGLACTFGSKIPERRRVKIAEAASRVNLLLWLGNFEVDFESGELRCRIGIDVEGGQLSETMLSNMLGSSLQAMENYHRAFMRIAFGGIEPTVALGGAV